MALNFEIDDPEYKEALRKFRDITLPDDYWTDVWTMFEEQYQRDCEQAAKEELLCVDKLG